MPLCIQQGVGLSDDVGLFTIRRKVHDLIRDLGDDLDGVLERQGRDALRQRLINARPCSRHNVAGHGIRDILAQDVVEQGPGIGRHGAHDLAIGRLDKAQVIDARKGGQTTDQANVRTFRGLDGADAAIVAVVNVAHIKAGAFTA